MPAFLHLLKIVAICLLLANMPVAANASLAAQGTEEPPMIATSSYEPARPYDAQLAMLQRTVDAKRAELEIPGCIVLVEMPDGQVYSVASGIDDLATASSIRVDQPYRIGSITKTFTATLALMLQQEGRVELDTLLTELVPEAPEWLPQYDGWEEVTLRRLLHHTSGLPDYVSVLTGLPPVLIRKVSGMEWTQAEMAQVPYPGTADFAPGMGCEYSNTNYLLAGLALERATGRGMAELLHDYIFDPLGMADTYYAATEATPEQARGYIRLDGDFVDATEWDNPQAAWATGCILSTVADQLKFVTAMKEVDRGGNELLGADSLAQQLDFRALGVDSDTEYGLGIARQEVEGHEVWGHSGGTLAYRAGTYWLPLEDIVVIGFSNWRHGDLESLLIAAVECFDPDE